MANIPRGFKANNPGNVRISDVHWLGKVTPSIDPDFETFDTLTHGVRCAAIIFRNYRKLDGLQTIQQFIARWAPPSDDNPTDAYAGYVASACDVPVDQPYDVTDAGNLATLLGAVFHYELGGAFVTTDQIAEGVAEVIPPTTDIS